MLNDSLVKSLGAYYTPKLQFFHQFSCPMCVLYSVKYHIMNTSTLHSTIYWFNIAFYDKLAYNILTNATVSRKYGKLKLEPLSFVPLVEYFYNMTRTPLFTTTAHSTCTVK